MRTYLNIWFVCEMAAKSHFYCFFPGSKLHLNPSIWAITGRFSIISDPLLWKIHCHRDNSGSFWEWMPLLNTQLSSNRRLGGQWRFCLRYFPCWWLDGSWWSGRHPLPKLAGLWSAEHPGPKKQPKFPYPTQGHFCRYTISMFTFFWKRRQHWNFPWIFQRLRE